MGAAKADRPDRVRGGGVALAAILVVASAAWATTLQLRERWPLATTLLPAGGFAVWATACGVAALLGRLRPAWSLTRAERLMLWWAVFGGSVVLPVAGGALLATLAGPSYFAFDPRAVVPRVPWLALDPDAARRWYEGGPPDPLPWLLPLVGWGISLAGLIVAQGVVAGALARRWRQEERLPVPLAQLPLACAGEARSLRRTPAFWLGVLAALTAFAIARWQGEESAPLAAGTAAVAIGGWRIWPLAVGLAYLGTPAVNLGIALTGVAAALLPSLVPLLGWGARIGPLPGPTLAAAGIGAAAAISVLTLWPLVRTAGRRAWRAAAVVALHLPAIGWASLQGERLGEVALATVGFWVLLIPALRLAVHAGIPLLPLPIGPGGGALGLLVTQAPGPAAVAWAQAEGREGERPPTSLAAGAIGWGMALAAVTATTTALALGYRHGAVNFGDLAPVAPLPPWSSAMLPAATIGAGLAAGLAVAQRRWSLVSPLGLVTLATPGLLGAIWPSVLLASVVARWAAHLGAASQYARLRPFFLGLIAGESLAVAGVGVWRTLL